MNDQDDKQEGQRSQGRNPFSFPGEASRQAEHLAEKRRLLYVYLRNGPRRFFKSIPTMCQELASAWPEEGWSRRTVCRLLADLENLGLCESQGKTSAQGMRIRRINRVFAREDDTATRPKTAQETAQYPRNHRRDKGYKREDGTSVDGQEQRNHREKTVVEREDGTLTQSGKYPLTSQVCGNNGQNIGDKPEDGTLTQKRSTKMALPQREDGTLGGREDGTQGSSLILKAFNSKSGESRKRFS
jgi:hypothetical protein